jgi:hypothetical protein
MGKIVIPKHSADVKEMEAVLKIHYDANDWVKGLDYKRKLKSIIGDDQYSSSYPKKAQVPSYFGFLECKISPGGKISERKITDSGKKMYEAIIYNSREQRQELLMDALEKIVFGRNNGGCASSKSDLDAPNLILRCILDTGYCTTKEYAFLVWNLNDKGRKYYQVLNEIIKARSAGGIILPNNIPDYTDWKPVLALVRWGFLIKGEEESRIMIHPEVLEMYPDRLNKIKIYNVDKFQDDDNELKIDEETLEQNENRADSSVFKPFKLIESTIKQIRTGHICEDIILVEQQHVFPGDNVLFVDKMVSRLLAYYSYHIKTIVVNDTKCEIDVECQQVINAAAEEKILKALQEEDIKNSSRMLVDLLKKIFSYEMSEENIKSISNNKDIEPMNLLIRSLLKLKSISKEELNFLIFGMIEGNRNFTDIIDEITGKRKNKESFQEKLNTQDYNNMEFIKQCENKGLFDFEIIDGQIHMVINNTVREHYEKRLSRLAIYAVDIIKLNTEQENQNSLHIPKVIKAIFFDRIITDQGDSDNLTLDMGKQATKYVQGDYGVLVNSELTQIVYPFVYQIETIDREQIVLAKRLVINDKGEEIILKRLKENE